MDPSSTLSDLSQLIGRSIARNEMRAEHYPEHSRKFREEAHHWEAAFSLLTKLIEESNERH